MPIPSPRIATIAMLLLVPLISGAQTSADTLLIEAVGMSELVAKYRPGTVNLDPTLFESVGEALIASQKTRPTQRQNALAAELRTQIFHSDSLPITVRATEPVFSGGEARVVVSVSRTRPSREREEWELRRPPEVTLIETVEFMLVRRGEEWTIRERRYPRRPR